MLAALITAIGYVPLKCKVFHSFDRLRMFPVLRSDREPEKSYFSPAPHEEPQAEVFGLLSPSPAPQAEGFGLLSPAPQADGFGSQSPVPHDDGLGVPSPSFEPHDEPHPEDAWWILSEAR